MGKIILCAGKEAAHPYYFQSAGVSISNMEELCYCIYHNIFAVKDELFSLDLVRFIREELGLGSRADYIGELIASHAGIKDLVVAIFCSTDYYDEREIKGFLQEYDAYCQLSAVERRKKEADRMLGAGREKEAASLYQEILRSEELLELPEKEYGNLLHNLAVIEIRNGKLGYAPDRFREAYERNHADESLKQYLMALKLTDQEELFETERKRLMPRQEIVDRLSQELYLSRNASEQTREFMELEKVRECYEQGRTEEYSQRAEALLKLLKSNYRNYI